MSAYTAARMIREYKEELNYLLEAKTEGKVFISELGHYLPVTGNATEIDNAIEDYKAAIQAVKDGADPEDYNF